MPKKSYNTKQREFLIDFFKSCKNQCFTIEEVLKHAESNGINIGQTTIYRNLEKLVDEGIILRHSMPPLNGAYFQYVHDKKDEHEHYHLYCTHCGNVTHLTCEHFDELLAHIQREHKFNFDNQKTVFYGCCEKCADSLNKHE